MAQFFLNEVYILFTDIKNQITEYYLNMNVMTVILVLVFIIQRFYAMQNTPEYPLFNHPLVDGKICFNSPVAELRV